MALVKLFKDETEYQGESYAKSLTKKNRSTWGSTATANYIMTDDAGNQVVTGDCTLSDDELALSLFIGKTETASLLGVHKLLVYLTDSVNTALSDVIAEYRITYSDTKAS